MNEKALGAAEDDWICWTALLKKSSALTEPDGDSTRNGVPKSDILRVYFWLKSVFSVFVEYFDGAMDISKLKLASSV